MTFCNYLGGVRKSERWPERCYRATFNDDEMRVIRNCMVITVSFLEQV